DKLAAGNETPRRLRHAPRILPLASLSVEDYPEAPVVQIQVGAAVVEERDLYDRRSASLAAARGESLHHHALSTRQARCHVDISDQYFRRLERRRTSGRIIEPERLASRRAAPE